MTERINLENFILSDIKIFIPDFLFNNNINRMLSKGWYEIEEKKALTRSLRSTDIFLEIGGGIGYTAMLGAKIVGAERVTTVEANPEVFQVLKMNIKENNLSEIKAINCVVIDEENTSDTCSFYIPPDFWSGSINNSCMNDGYKKTNVKSISISNLIDCVKPSVLMVDAEGAEVNFFKKSIPKKLRLIIIELHPEKYLSVSIKKIFQRLDREGFFYQPNGSNGSIVVFERL